MHITTSFAAHVTLCVHCKSALLGEGLMKMSNNRIISAQIALMEADIKELRRKLQRSESIRDSIRDENLELYSQLHDLKVSRFHRFNNEECWIYQGDGSDHLDSLICPVVIDAKTLIKLELSDKEIEKEVIERDYWEEKATELAMAIGEHLGIDVGEHSSMNCPVRNALESLGT